MWVKDAFEVLNKTNTVAELMDDSLANDLLRYFAGIEVSKSVVDGDRLPRVFSELALYVLQEFMAPHVHPARPESIGRGNMLEAAAEPTRCGRCIGSRSSNCKAGAMGAGGNGGVRLLGVSWGVHGAD